MLLFIYSVFYSLSCLAPNMKHILAVANEEGFVRLYNTESQTYRKKCVKGKSRSKTFVLTLFLIHKASSKLFEYSPNYSHFWLDLFKDRLKVNGGLPFCQ